MQFSAIFSGLSQADEARETRDTSTENLSATDKETDETHPKERGGADVETASTTTKKPSQGELDDNTSNMMDEAPLGIAARALKAQPTGEKSIPKAHRVQSLAEVSLWPKADQIHKHIGSAANSSSRLDGNGTVHAPHLVAPTAAATSVSEYGLQKEPAKNVNFDKALSQPADQEPKFTENAPAPRFLGRDEAIPRSIPTNSGGSEVQGQDQARPTINPVGARPLNLPVGLTSKETEHFSGNPIKQVSKTSGMPDVQKPEALPNSLDEKKPSLIGPISPPAVSHTNTALSRTSEHTASPREVRNPTTAPQHDGQTEIRLDHPQSAQAGAARPTSSAGHILSAVPDGQLPPTLTSGITTAKTGREARDSLPNMDRSEPEAVAIDKTQAPLVTAQTRVPLTAKSFALPHQSSDAATSLGLGSSDENSESELIQTQLTEQSRSVSQTPTQFAAKTGIPQHIPRQLAEVIHTSGSKSVDVALNPEELGRVRLSISQAEGGLVVNVQAERPETLDMLRRNIDQLDQELKLLGYADPGFSFSHEGGDANQERDGISTENSIASDQQEAPVDDADADNRSSPLNTAGLDIRL
ncbi:flagellar hook-length control protein FliK [Sulfitobacter sp.]|jgi:flagellar hook-length control protein FliK|uniref:flagellar hook-length control protein FliK n=1 Tax=Sulfitobacter sp. TaxID=1903071 RepID=UPI0039E44B7E